MQYELRNLILLEKRRGSASTAPVLYGANFSSVTDSTGVGSIYTTGVNGTIYLVVVPYGDVPTPTQIKAGQQSSGAAAVNALNQAVSGSGLQTFSASSGMTASTHYNVWFIHRSTLPEDSSPISTDFTTTISTGSHITTEGGDTITTETGDRLII